MIYLLDLFGVAVFAITGSLAARRKQLDLFGVIVIALVTAIGGGTLRDLILGQTPVFWIQDSTYIVIGVFSALLTFIIARFNLIPRRALILADAFGLALFSVLGTQTALNAGVEPLPAVIMGMMTGTAGGIIRDLLTNEIPLILRSEIYATASLLGATTFVLLDDIPLTVNVQMSLAMLVTLCLRLIAIRRRWNLPVFKETPPKNTKGQSDHESP